MVKTVIRVVSDSFFFSECGTTHIHRLSFRRGGVPDDDNTGVQIGPENSVRTIGIKPKRR